MAKFFLRLRCDYRDDILIGNESAYTRQYGTGARAITPGWMFESTEIN